MLFNLREPVRLYIAAARSPPLSGSRDAFSSCWARQAREVERRVVDPANVPREQVLNVPGAQRRIEVAVRSQIQNFRAVLVDQLPTPLDDSQRGFRCRSADLSHHAHKRQCVPGLTGAGHFT